jgi:hypothetical protein
MRIRHNVWRTALLLAEHLKKNIRCEVPLASGILERYLLFLRWLVEVFLSLGDLS